MAKGNGIENKGKTKGKNLGDSGPSAKTLKGNKPVGVSNEMRLADGKSRSRLDYQFGSIGLKGKGF